MAGVTPEAREYVAGLVGRTETKRTFCEVLDELRGKFHSWSEENEARLKPLYKDQGSPAFNRALVGTNAFRSAEGEVAHAMRQQGCYVEGDRRPEVAVPYRPMASADDPPAYSGPDLTDVDAEEIVLAHRYRTGIAREHDRLARVREEARRSREYGFGHAPPSLEATRARQKRLREEFLKMSPEDRAARLDELGVRHTVVPPKSG